MRTVKWHAELHQYGADNEDRLLGTYDFTMQHMDNAIYEARHYFGAERDGCTEVNHGARCAVVHLPLRKILSIWAVGDCNA